MQSFLSKLRHYKLFISLFGSSMIAYGTYYLYVDYLFRRLNKKSYELFQLKKMIWKKRNNSQSLVPLLAIDSTKC